MQRAIGYALLAVAVAMLSGLTAWPFCGYAAATTSLQWASP